jgi:hypothetical protein
MDATITGAELYAPHAELVEPGRFDPEHHYYPRVCEGELHPLVAFFLGMSSERLVGRYCRLHPRVPADALARILGQAPAHFRWSGVDLFHTTTPAGERHMIVVETNSSPSGHKSMPRRAGDPVHGSYRALVERSLLPLAGEAPRSAGGLAVLYDKNHTEASGYAATLADLAGEPVYLAPFADGHAEAPARFADGLLQVRDARGAWNDVRAALRYVTQRPWNRIPVRTRTRLLNPVVACLGGGRNKLVAAKAYELYNAEIERDGLAIVTPETIFDVARDEIPLWVRRFGGQAVVKVPYANAGQGVFTIVSARELEHFMISEQRYERYVVQSLVGSRAWSSGEVTGRRYHVGTMPDARGDVFAADLRLMISAGGDGFRPVALYARRARRPLGALAADTSSWDMLGTNLSERRGDGGWWAATERLLVMDGRDFERLGLGLDDLIEAFVQSVLATVAVDQMCKQLVDERGRLRIDLFRSLDDDERLLAEIASDDEST